MNRTAWKFVYPADKLLSAAKAKYDFHTGRLEWWENKKTDTLKTIKAEGLEIDESVAAMGYASNSGRQTSVNIRNDLMRDLQECLGKVTEHTAKRRDYAAWSEVLASQGQTAFDLHQEDWLFFFSK